MNENEIKTKTITKNDNRMKKLSLMLMALLCLPLGGWGGRAWAQTDFGQLPEILSMEKARITDVGVAVRDIEVYVKQDSLTQKTDTALFISNPEVIWQSEQVNVYDSVNVDRAMMPRRATRRKALQDAGLEQWGNLMPDFFLDFFYDVFRFDYPSVDANGNPIMLSAIAACPTDARTKENSWSDVWNNE